MEKIKVGIIGSGNIGCDLLMKVQKSPYLQCSLFMGQRPDSKGMLFAQNLGIKTSDRSINALIDNPELCDIVFDATTAKAHFKHSKILKKMKKFTIDLTPSLIGEMCIPNVNGLECLNFDNINMITCGGQATIPFVSAISKIQEGIRYIEIVASISSKSAGAGTRLNIDEFTQTTQKALSLFSGVKNTKAIIVLNPAEPPIIMTNTIYMIVDNPNMDKIEKIVKEQEQELQKYIPEYQIIVGPLYKNNILTIIINVEGSGDYLEKYSGNLDIITCASVKMADMFAQRRINNGKNINF